MLMKSSTQSLTEQLSARISERIRNRLLAPGARLPSVRQCAQQNGVSPSTVVAAYDQLLALGLVEARKNRGFFVRDSGGADTAAGADARTGQQHQPEVLARHGLAAGQADPAFDAADQHQQQPHAAQEQRHRARGQHGQRLRVGRTGRGGRLRRVEAWHRVPARARPGAAAARVATARPRGRIASRWGSRGRCWGPPLL